MSSLMGWCRATRTSRSIRTRRRSPSSPEALLALSLMLSQAMESVTRAFYTRSDLDLLLSSRRRHRRSSRCGSRPSRCRHGYGRAARRSLHQRAGGRRRRPLLGAYGAVAAMGATAAALAVGLTTALFRIIGPKRTRLVAQIVAAVIGAASSSACSLPRSRRTERCRVTRCSLPSRSSPSHRMPAASYGGRRARCSATASRSGP